MKTPDNSALRVDRTIVVATQSAGPQSMTAAYARFANPGAADRLLAVTCDCADRVELHHMVGEGEARKMVTEEEFSIPANATSVIEPPGLEWHMMLVGLKEPLPVGEAVSMTMQFEIAGTRSLDFVAVESSADAWRAMDEGD
ncbi:copper chaperone PCu(A)C [Sphingomicrobium clamense]|uniref:Copper chaperone PCu(A)C n=1 Tax=Sphingomicrobium clamense TaxID=2851013 RepID=A0ABS6V573_9SPHN|nr:copper chaperone PCu(A)C [Sphingomicrobium sp. B8]MBW0144700.1 copper chaperone PCu(A)C [Sphingomicrobium sp. B8]